MEQISAEYKISMSSICDILRMAAYSVRIPDVSVKFFMHRMAGKFASSLVCTRET